MTSIGYYLLFFAVLSINGLIFIGVGLHTVRYQRKKEENETESARGVIVDIAKKKTRPARGRSVTYYVPVIEFTAGEKLYRLENENGERQEDKITVGKEVRVMYDRREPEKFHLTEDDANDTSGRSLIRFGAILIAGSAAVTVAAWVFRVF